MEEIANNIYMESAYPGVVVAAFNFRHGLVMIDAPFRAEDIRSWRASLLNLGGGVDKMLVMMDTHIDRTLGVKLMETSVLGHENSVQILKNRPSSARSQDIDAGSDWEPFDLPANIRWVVPNMTYSEQLFIYWDETPLVVTHQPGAHIAGSWVRYDQEKILLVGDTVILDQPPFLSWSDIDVWLEELAYLQSEVFKGYKIINGRNGLVKAPAIEHMIVFLRKLKKDLDQLAEDDGDIEAVQALAPDYMRLWDTDPLYADLYQKRLVWGIAQYYERHYLMSETQGDD